MISHRHRNCGIMCLCKKEYVLQIRICGVVNMKKENFKSSFRYSYLLGDFCCYWGISFDWKHWPRKMSAYNTWKHTNCGWNCWLWKFRIFTNISSDKRRCICIWWISSFGNQNCKMGELNSMFVLSIITAVISLLPLVYGLSYFTFVGALITMALVTECILIKMQQKMDWFGMNR